MIRSILIALLALSAAVPALATPTEIVVRVISEDAKFIGDAMGGADVTLRAARSGRILARGRTAGGTGDTARIMQANGRSPLISTPDAAAFIAQIEIDEPTLVDLEVTGPNARPGSQISIVSQRWVMPGQSINTGDGWVVELPGLAISPIANVIEGASVGGGRSISVSARVELLCGCPITPGGQWDANDYQVTVSVWRRGRRVAEAPLLFVSSPGGFAGQVQMPVSGRFRLFVHARNVVTGNSGVSEVNLTEGRTP